MIPSCLFLTSYERHTLFFSRFSLSLVSAQLPLLIYVQLTFSDVRFFRLFVTTRKFFFTVPLLLVSLLRHSAIVKVTNHKPNTVAGIGVHHNDKHRFHQMSTTFFTAHYARHCNMNFLIRWKSHSDLFCGGNNVHPDPESRDRDLI